MAFCTKCGAPCGENDRFCGKCGAPKSMPQQQGFQQSDQSGEYEPAKGKGCQHYSQAQRHKSG